jgi:hypothetical protein
VSAHCLLHFWIGSNNPFFNFKNLCSLAKTFCGLFPWVKIWQAVTAESGCSQVVWGQVLPFSSFLHE